MKGIDKKMKIIYNVIEYFINMNVEVFVSKLIERIDIPAEYRTTTACSPTAIIIYDDHAEVEGPRASSYFYNDFTGISTQNASILCAYASIIFLNAVSASSTWKNDVPVLTDMNRLLLCGGMFSYKRVNAYAIEVATKIRKALEAFKSNKTTGVAVDVTEELKKFKELLDSGVITQEDYDAKKKQLLGL